MVIQGIIEEAGINIYISLLFLARSWRGLFLHRDAKSSEGSTIEKGAGSIWVVSGIQWHSVAFSDIQWHSVTFSGSYWQSVAVNSSQGSQLQSMAVLQFKFQSNERTPHYHILAFS